jgi:hypothetical protein
MTLKEQLELSCVVITNDPRKNVVQNVIYKIAEAEAIAKAEGSEIVENSVGPRLCCVVATEAVCGVQGREARRRPRKPRKRIVRKFREQSEKRFQLIVRRNKNKMSSGDKTDAFSSAVSFHNR